MKFLNQMSLGTKASACIVAVFAFCMIVMTILLTNSSAKIQEKESQKLIANVAARVSNIIDSYMKEIIAVLKLSQDSIEEMLLEDRNLQEQIKDQIYFAIDATSYATYAYVYLKDTSVLNGEVMDSKYKLPNNEFMILVTDTNIDKKGGVEILQADEAIAHFDSVQKALQTGQETMGEPSWQSIGNFESRFGFGVNYPLFDKNHKVIGVVGMFIDEEALSKSVLSDRFSVFDQDYRTLLSSQANVVAHPNKDVIGKSFTALNTDPSAAALLNAIQNKQDALISYKNIQGTTTFAGIKILDLGKLGYMVSAVVAPQESIFAPVYDLRRMIILMVLVCLSIGVVFTIFYVRKAIVSRVNNISKQLLSFFDYINHKTNTMPKSLPPKAHDELGLMALAINESIQKTQIGLTQDQEAVQQSVQTVHIVEEGDLSARITASPKNPQLIELKNVLNRLLDVLQHRVGSNLNTIREVFEEYRNLDFRNKIPNASGNVEITTNILGDEIVKMLKTSSDFANSLSEESGKLQEAVNALTQSSNSQAHSLEETAAALEQITSSMQNVSTKTSDVITQSEEIKNV
ncbi:chemotaxis protein, partial [Campylobacter sp. MIT 12-8780]|uniref:PDC sensor domain-containing protein n=1 Tax=Campylobacter sp. MIT 12-8780 TaxID=2202200 RepID=UPI00115EC9CB